MREKRDYSDWSARELRQRQNAIRSLYNDKARRQNVLSLADIKDLEDDLIEIYEEFKNRGSENPGGNSNPFKNLEIE